VPATYSEVINLVHWDLGSQHLPMVVVFPQPHCQTLMIRSTSKMIAAISFISCPGSWNTMVTQLGVTADCRGCGYESFLLVALQKALLVLQMDDGPATVYLQCLDSRHEDTVYPFYIARGFSELAKGDYAEPSASGVEHLPKDLRDLA
jgi:hypothetical protein